MEKDNFPCGADELLTKKEETKITSDLKKKAKKVEGIGDTAETRGTEEAKNTADTRAAEETKDTAETMQQKAQVAQKIQRETKLLKAQAAQEFQRIRVVSGTKLTAGIECVRASSGSSANRRKWTVGAKVKRKINSSR